MELRLTRQTTSLVVMDVQDRLVAAMPDEARSMAVDNVIRLVQGARILDLPTIATEQYPAGLGSTIESVDAALREGNPEGSPIDKLEFNACDDLRFAEAIESASRTQSIDGSDLAPALVLCGMETHICIYQTARALCARGYRLHVPHDATCCRRPADHEVALRLLEHAGAIVTSTETVLFDLLGKAGADDFKAINKLVR